MAFIYYNENPEGLQTDDCVVRAIALFLNDTWENVYTDLSMQGFNMHRMPSTNDVWGHFLYQNGFKRCCCKQSINYLVGFGANISIPAGGTAGSISLAIAIDGSTEPETTMTVTPAAAEEPFNVSRSSNIPIWIGCCETVTVRNISDQPIVVENANITFVRN